MPLYIYIGLFLILSPAVLYPRLYKAFRMPKILRRIPNPLRERLLEFVWNNRHLIKSVHFKEFALELRKVLRFRNFADKRNGFIHLIRILWDDGYLTKEQYDLLIDAVDKAFPLSSLTVQKGQCPHIFASNIFNKAFKALKGNGILMSAFWTLIEDIRDARTRGSKWGLHFPLFRFLSKKLNIDAWSCSFINVTDIYCKKAVKGYWVLYKICKDFCYPEAELLGKTIEKLEGSKSALEAVGYHRMIYEILKGIKFPLKTKKLIQQTIEYVCWHYGIND